MEAQKISVKDIQVDPNQPRKIYANMEQLTESIKNNGFDPYKAIMCRTCPDPEGRKYQAIWGNRRTMASELAGVEYLWAYVVDGMSDQEIYEQQLMENEHREDLRPMERALAIKEGLGKGISHNRMAKILAVSVSTLKADLELCTLAPELHRFVDNGQLSKDVARKLATSFDTEKQQMSVFNNWVKGAGSTKEKLAAIQAYLDKNNQQKLDIFDQAKRDAGDNGGLSKARKASEKLDKVIEDYRTLWANDPNVINARKRELKKVEMTAQKMADIAKTIQAQVDAYRAKIVINAPKIAVNA